MRFLSWFRRSSPHTSSGPTFEIRGGELWLDGAGEAVTAVDTVVAASARRVRLRLRGPLLWSVIRKLASAPEQPAEQEGPVVQEHPAPPDIRLKLCYELALRGIDHQPKALGDLRVRTSALVGGAAVITALFAPTAVEANTLAAWFYGGAAGALLLGLIFSRRIFASLPDGGETGYTADVDRYVAKRTADHNFNAKQWVNEFRDVKRKWRITFTPDIVSSLSDLAPPEESPYVELTRFIDFTRIRNWEVIEDRTGYFGVAMWCFALELALGLVGLGLAT